MALPWKERAVFASPGHSLSAPGLVDLVANGTMSAEIAATLATAAAERRSLLLIAEPRQAGKTTVLRGTLNYAPDGTPVHAVTRARPDLGIPAADDGGYLYMAEVSRAGFHDYLWGESARRVFDALPRGFSLATALHAPGVEEGFFVLCDWNRVPDDLAGRIDLAVYLEILGSWWAPAARRVVEVREIESVEAGRPRGAVLFRWQREHDRFEAVSEPSIIGSRTRGGIASRIDEFVRAP
jgi:hypothetical protein